MNPRIQQCFATLKTEGRAAFIPFIMGGDPNTQHSASLLSALPEAGADIIEVGIPFSDPMADGPTIQAAGLRALKAGMTLKALLAMIRVFRKTNDTTPIVLMGYYNPIYHYGVEAFAKDASEAGVDGLICVDVPYEEMNELKPSLDAHQIDIVPLVAPTSLSDARLPKLLSQANGYLYYVSIAGITGAAGATRDSIQGAIDTIRNHTDLPVCVGFGIKTPEDVAALKDVADGVVVGSAIVKTIETEQDNPDLLSLITTQVADLSAALK